MLVNYPSAYQAQNCRNSLWLELQTASCCSIGGSARLPRTASPQRFRKVVRPLPGSWQSGLRAALLLLPHSSAHVIHSPLVLGVRAAARLQECQRAVRQARKIAAGVLVEAVHRCLGRAVRFPVVENLHRDEIGALLAASAVFAEQLQSCKGDRSSLPAPEPCSPHLPSVVLYVALQGSERSISIPESWIALVLSLALCDILRTLRMMVG